MSKRFGRNQRRRAREAITAAQNEAQRFQTAYAMTAGLLEETSRKRADLQQELDEAKVLAGRMSILFPAETMEDRRLRGDRTTWEVAMPSRLSYASMERMVAARETTLRSMPLPLLVSAIHEDALGQAIHVLVRFANEETCYSASRLALATMPLDRLRQVIAGQVAQDLGRKIDARRRW